MSEDKLKFRRPSMAPRFRKPIAENPLDPKHAQALQPDAARPLVPMIDPSVDTYYTFTGDELTASLQEPREALPAPSPTQAEDQQLLGELEEQASPELPWLPVNLADRYLTSFSLRIAEAGSASGELVADAAKWALEAASLDDSLAGRVVDKAEEFSEKGAAILQKTRETIRDVQEDYLKAQLDKQGIFGNPYGMAAAAFSEIADLAGMLTADRMMLKSLKMPYDYRVGGLLRDMSTREGAKALTVAAGKLAVFRAITTPGDAEDRISASVFQFLGSMAAYPAWKMAPSHFSAKAMDFLLGSGVDLAEPDFWRGLSEEQKRLKAKGFGDHASFFATMSLSKVALMNAYGAKDTLSRKRLVRAAHVQAGRWQAKVRAIHDKGWEPATRIGQFDTVEALRQYVQEQPRVQVEADGAVETQVVTDRGVIVVKQDGTLLVHEARGGEEYRVKPDGTVERRSEAAFQNASFETDPKQNAGNLPDKLYFEIEEKAAASGRQVDDVIAEMQADGSLQERLVALKKAETPEQAKLPDIDEDRAQLEAELEADTQMRAELEARRVELEARLAESEEQAKETADLTATKEQFSRLDAINAELTRVYEQHRNDPEFRQYLDEAERTGGVVDDRHVARILTKYFSELSEEAARYLEFEAEALDFEGEQGVGSYKGMPDGQVHGSHITTLRDTLFSLRDIVHEAEATRLPEVPEEPGERAELIRELIGKYDNEEIREGLGNPKDVPIEQLRRFLRPIDEETAKQLNEPAKPPADREALQAELDDINSRLAADSPDQKEQRAFLERLESGDKVNIDELWAQRSWSITAQRVIRELAKATGNNVDKAKKPEDLLVGRKVLPSSHLAFRDLDVDTLLFMVREAQKFDDGTWHPGRITEEEFRAKVEEFGKKHAHLTSRQMLEEAARTLDPTEKAIMLNFTLRKEYVAVSRQYKALRQLIADGNRSTRTIAAANAAFELSESIYAQATRFGSLLSLGLRSLQFASDADNRPIAEIRQEMLGEARPERLLNQLGDLMRWYQRINTLGGLFRGIDGIGVAYRILERATNLDTSRAVGKLGETLHWDWLARKGITQREYRGALDMREVGRQIATKVVMDKATAFFSHIAQGPKAMWQNMEAVKPLRDTDAAERGEMGVIPVDSSNVKMIGNQVIQKALRIAEQAAGRKINKTQRKEAQNIIENASKAERPAEVMVEAMASTKNPLVKALWRAWDEMGYAAHSMAFGAMQIGDSMRIIEQMTTVGREAARITELRIKAGLLDEASWDKSFNSLVEGAMLKLEYGDDAHVGLALDNKNTAHFKKTVDDILHVANRWGNWAIMQPQFDYKGDTFREKVGRNIGKSIDFAGHSFLSFVPAVSSLTLYLRTSFSIGGDWLFDRAWPGISPYKLTAPWAEATREGNRAEQAELRAKALRGSAARILGNLMYSGGYYQGPLNEAATSMSAATQNKGSSWDVHAMWQDLCQAMPWLDPTLVPKGFRLDTSRIEPFSQEMDEGALIGQLFTSLNDMAEGPYSGWKLPGGATLGEVMADAKGTFGKLSVIYMAATKLETDDAANPFREYILAKLLEIQRNGLINQGPLAPVNDAMKALAAGQSGFKRLMESHVQLHLPMGSMVRQLWGGGKRYMRFASQTAANQVLNEYSQSLTNAWNAVTGRRSTLNDQLAYRIASDFLPSGYDSRVIPTIYRGMGLGLFQEDQSPWEEYLSDNNQRLEPITSSFHFKGTELYMNPTEAREFLASLDPDRLELFMTAYHRKLMDPKDIRTDSQKAASLREAWGVMLRAEYVEYVATSRSMIEKYLNEREKTTVGKLAVGSEERTDVQQAFDQVRGVMAKGADSRIEQARRQLAVDKESTLRLLEEMTGISVEQLQLERTQSNE